MPIQSLNEGMTWSQVIAILNLLINQSNNLSSAIGGAVVGGRIDYNALANLPSINGVTIIGDTTAAGLGSGSTPGGNSESTVLARAEAVATAAATAAVQGKADSSTVEALQQALAQKLSALTVNIRAVYPTLQEAQQLQDSITAAYDSGSGDTTLLGSQILILSPSNPGSLSILTFQTEGWQSISVPLGTGGGGVQSVTVRAIADKDGGSQIAAITVDGITTNIYSPAPQEGTVPIDITFSADPADNRVPSSRCVWLALEEKADKVALEALVEALEHKADKQDLLQLTNDVEDLSDQVQKKADQSALENLAGSLNNKADKADTYTKQQIDNALTGKADKADTYTKQQVDNALTGKADKDNTYTKQQVDAALADKVSAKQDAANAGKTLVIDSEGNVIPGDPASDGNTLNLGRPQSGFYTLATAIAAVPAKKRKGGLCITYMTAENTWETKQYTLDDVSQWTTEGNWRDVSGNKVVVDHDLDPSSTNPIGNDAVAQRIFDLENSAVSHVDDSLDPESTNPVQNKVIAQAVTALQNPSFDAEVLTGDDGQQVILSKDGREVTRFTVTGGGGGPAVQTSRITLNAYASTSKVKEGGHSILSWFYDHLNADGISDGIPADITVTIRRGAVTLHEETLSSVAPSTQPHLITLDPWLTTAGTVGVTVRAAAVDGGVQQSKQFYVPLSVVSLSLSLNNASALISKAMEGGYASTDTIIVGYTVKGSGSKIVSLYLDGADSPTTATVSKSGTTNGQFSIAASSLSPGRHTLQLVAENDDLLSESTFIDILVAGSSAPFIGLLFTRDDGLVFLGSSHLTPSVAATQYAVSSFYFFAYDPSTTTATVSEYRNGNLNQSFSVGRTRQTYTTRFTEAGTISERYVCGLTEYPFSIVVEPSSIDVQKATASLSLELSAAGRSNDESNPAVWSHGEAGTSFVGFDWKSSGWNGDALVMRNGARILVAAYPFNTDAAITGRTVEMEFRISNIIDSSADIISCLSSGKGFHVTGSQASLLTGSGVPMVDGDGNPVLDELGNPVYRPVGVEKTFAADTDIKLAFVIGSRVDGRLLELYVNGTREKADIYNTTDNFVQNVPVGISFDSAAADIELRSLRIYDRALDDDELVDNFIVDRPDPADMLAKYNENDVLENGLYDITKILSKGKGVVHFIRPKGLDEVNSANNKSTDFLTDVIYYSPFGPEWDLKIEGCNVRIQGTSSTKYPRKNYRIYLLKGSKTRKVYRRDSSGNWTDVTAIFEGYIFRSGGREAPLICLKADYSDSSMTMNTGGAKLFEFLMRQLGYLTPPQEVDSSVRQAIDGFPVDVFCTDTEDPTNAVRYYGQYNFNHDKGKSKNIFGHVKITDDQQVQHNFSASIALEGLNNSNPFCLFQSAGSADSDALADQLTAYFDKGFEFNHPEDTVWVVTDPAKQTSATAAQRTAIQRLFGWIYDCFIATAGVQAGTMTVANPDYGTADGWTEQSRAKWVCPKFKAELSDYFHVGHLCTYYVYADYHMSVDQLAKNTILRTWDLLHWFVTYYDGDTQLGKRNDSFLAYGYTLSRDTWDYDKSKYAFEGHNSWLWCLLLANFDEELKAAAKAMRNILTNQTVLHMFNVEQQGNWCERAYNKSGEFKYIIPATEGVTVIQDGQIQTGVTYPFIYALDGTNNSHRVHTILHRFALLDAKYGCDTFHDDNVGMYLSRSADEPDGSIAVTANAPYYFDWGTKNVPYHSPVQADEGDTVTLTFSGQMSLNDPVDLYGASCIERIDLSGVAGSLQNGINLNKAKLLREINASSSITRIQDWFFTLDQCTRLRLIDCTNQHGVKTGTLSSTEFNVSNQTRLEILRLGGTAVTAVELAEGAPISVCVLPGTLTVLKLRYLPLLTMQGLSIQGYDSITTLNFANCPGLDWVELASRCPNLDRLRVEGLDFTDDGTVLARYKNLKGIDADGNAVPHCQLIGYCRLSRYIDTTTFDDYVNSYPGLTIIQPEYTLIEFDDSISDDANISNLDNRTGYKFDNDYAPSGHVLQILNRRHRVLAKNTAEGTCTIFPLHDANSAKFADSPDITLCSDASLNGSQGDVMMYEPGRWYKGINDFLNKKHYACYSSADHNHKPPTPPATIFSFDDLNGEGLVRPSYAILTGRTTLSESYSSNSSYSVVHVHVNGFSRVRFPSIPGSDFRGAIFTDASGSVVGSTMVETLSGGFESGMYVIANIPSGATELYFTILKTAEFDKVVLSNSSKIEDMETEWVWADPCLVGVAESSIVSDKLRSVMTSAASAASLSWTDFSYYSAQRGTGYQQIDYEMHKDIANLFFARYGRRNSQAQCGAGSASAGRAMNGTVSLGMKDTVNPSSADEGAWYINANGDLVSISNNNVLGYQDLQGDKAEWMDRVTVNDGSVTGKWSILMPDGTTRLVKGATVSGYIKAVVHGLFMDIVPAGNILGSSTTYYCDFYTYGAFTGRVVCRSYNFANAYGGVAGANASYAPSSSHASIGSRLAFRGTIVTAASVTAFLALTEIA